MKMNAALSELFMLRYEICRSIDNAISIRYKHRLLFMSQSVVFIASFVDIKGIYVDYTTGRIDIHVADNVLHIENQPTSEDVECLYNMLVDNTVVDEHALETQLSNIECKSGQHQS